ncbi:uncharacterized protein B0H64DRAFT_397106 [Chaetomium fimeti]|uniref:Transcription factor Iwr1 domain-containing protein n=1 Tax=Chaetomium fimeti TaxID=1854472 RepID=A0AAE0HGH1_9PEZI|nr:hypothetical protein B0H64DRAFT_397106 [Chaetomium fimeti]
MAGLPPDIIQVKRKRGKDDDPVDFLRLEETKRSRSSDGGWVYQRKPADVARASHAAAEPPSPKIPVIQPTRDGDGERPVRHPRKRTRAPARDDAAATGAAPDTPNVPEQPAPTASSHSSTDRIRRFHMARSNSPQPTAGVSKRRAVPAVFVERGAKKQRETLKAKIQEHNVTPAESPTPVDGSPPLGPSLPANENRAPSPVKYKRPGHRACTSTSDNKPTLPPSMREREKSDVNELARVMDSWTLDEITKNLNKMEEQSTKSKSSPAKSRFRPKPPKKRYFERHPESLAPKQQQPPVDATSMDVDVRVVGDSTDEEDYVLETYERVPAQRLQERAVPPHMVGVLMFDTEPDMVDFFYGNEDDSDEEFPEDDEDENAENYYAADYPEEDLDWDDEFGRNPYSYTNTNDSDREEFDERDYDDDGFENGDQVGVPQVQAKEWTF